jgi:hypothetical protein
MKKLEDPLNKRVVLLLFLSVISVTNVLAQEKERGISYAAGIGLVGEEKMNGIGPYVSVFLPILENSEIKVDLSYNSFPPPHFDGYDNFKIVCFEADYRFVYEPGPAFIQAGLGLNANMVNGGYSHQEISGTNKYEPYKNTFGLGIGLNIGIGFYVATKFAVCGEFAAQGVLGKAEKGWGGIKIGLRYFPMKKKVIIKRDWLNK